PYFTVLIIATISKLFGFYIIFKIFFFIYNFSKFYYIFIFICSFYSIIYGTIGALFQTNFKRLIGYSSITHAGFIISNLLIFTFNSFIFAIFYLIVYIFLSL